MAHVDKRSAVKTVFVFGLYRDPSFKKETMIDVPDSGVNNWEPGDLNLHLCVIAPRN